MGIVMNDQAAKRNNYLAISYDNECNIIIRSDNSSLKVKIYTSELNRAKLFIDEEIAKINGKVNHHSMRIYPFNFYIYQVAVADIYIYKIQIFAESDHSIVMRCDPDDLSNKITAIRDAIYVTLDSMVETGNVVTETEISTIGF
jgi:hypothetical protein